MFTSGDTAQILSEAADAVTALALDPVAGWLAVSVEHPAGLKEPVIECWSLGEKPAKTTVRQDLGARSLAISPDGKTLAAGYPDGGLAWFNLETGKPVKHLPAVGQFPVWTIAFHPSGSYLACGTADKGGRPNSSLIDLTGEKVFDRLSADPQAVALVSFSPAGDRLATFGAGGAVKIWNAQRLLRRE